MSKAIAIKVGDKVRVQGDFHNNWWIGTVTVVDGRYAEVEIPETFSTPLEFWGSKFGWDSGSSLSLYCVEAA